MKHAQTQNGCWKVTEDDGKCLAVLDHRLNKGFAERLARAFAATDHTITALQLAKHHLDGAPPEVKHAVLDALRRVQGRE